VVADAMLRQVFLNAKAGLRNHRLRPRSPHHAGFVVFGTASMRNSCYPRLQPLGDAAWIIEYGRAIDGLTHERVMGLAQALTEGKKRGQWPSIVEWVPAYASLTVHFAADEQSDAPLEAAEALLALARDTAPLLRPGRRWRLPVCFDAEFALDLHELAQACRMSPQQVVALMTGAPFRVYMLGFQPGFPYMGGLPAALELPRRATPRTAVPERSLAVAGRMCAVYPWRSPGGWHLLGRTPLALFDATIVGDPAWLHPGDEVRWAAIDRATFDGLERAAAAGTLRRDAWFDASGAGP
jgi:inhibitor of KinA